ncbi:MAG TPA: CHASE3 domain-containing protein [Caulobacteraceae bacterium]|jgi:signal transduction histidine kinase/ActR/RegA family two-component response regulator|nr:CHASE3 domain-containing protein [Caulobacteraceae bacterium]
MGGVFGWGAMLLRDVFSRIPREEQWVVGALSAAFVFLVLASAAAIVGTVRSANAENWVVHTVEVRRLNQEIYSTVQSAALGTRGYVINHEPTYLEGIGEARTRTPAMLKHLEFLVRDNPAQVARVRDLAAAINRELTTLDGTIALAAHTPRGDIAIRATPLTAVRDGSEAVDRAEIDLMRQRQHRAALERGVLLAAVIASLLAAGALAWFVLRSTQHNLELVEDRNIRLAAEMEGRMRAEAQLRQAQKMEALGQLTGGVAHDFNNMLAIIIGNMDLLQRKLAKGETKIGVYADNAMSGAQRAAVLTQSLLAFSRQQPLEPKSLDVNKTVAEMSRLLERTLGEPVAVETVLAGGLWPAFIDGAQLESAMLNLGVNARDAMANGGKLTIETANTYLDDAYVTQEAGGLKSGQYVMVAFTDTGEGIASDIVERVFDPFFTTKAPGKGTGLGLSQVHGFIKQSGGHVKIYSECGVGTTVKLYLPRAASDRATAAMTAHTPDQAEAGQAVVLVVEDDASVRAFVCDGVRDLGHRVIEAQSVETALAALDAAPEIELILTDVVMPGATGRVLADEARKRRPDLPVVYMTGYTRNAIVHNGVLDPGALLLNKPFTLKQLASKLKEALGSAASTNAAAV